MWLSREQNPQKVAQRLSAGEQPIHTKGQLVTEADSTRRSVACPGSPSWPGPGGFLKVMDGFAPARALRELLNRGHAAGSSSSSISKNKMQMRNKIAVGKATGEILVSERSSGQSGSAARKRSACVCCSCAPWLLCLFNCS